MFKINEVVASGSIADVKQISADFFEISLTSGVVATVSASGLPKTAQQGSKVTLFGKLALHKSDTFYAVHEVSVEPVDLNSKDTVVESKSQGVDSIQSPAANTDNKMSRVVSNIASKARSRIETKIPDIPRVEIPEDVTTGFDAKPSLTSPANASRAVKPLKMEPPTQTEAELTDLHAGGPIMAGQVSSPESQTSSPKAVIPRLSKLTAEKPEDPSKMLKLGPPPFAMETPLVDRNDLAPQSNEFGSEAHAEKTPSIVKVTPNVARVSNPRALSGKGVQSRVITTPTTLTKDLPRSSAIARENSTSRPSEQAAPGKDRTLTTPRVKTAPVASMKPSAPRAVAVKVAARA